MSGALLQVRAVTKRFGGLAAVNDVSFDIERGQVFGLIGPNGAGKSTLFNVIAGALPPTSGSIRFCGSEIAGALAHEVARRGLSRAFQLVNLFHRLTVHENVLVGAERGLQMGWWGNVTHFGSFRKGRAASAAQAAKAMSLAGVQQLAASPIHALSYGQQRLVATARALAADPQLLLLDEPGAGLSESEVEQVRCAILKARDSGITVLMVEHNVPFIMSIADRMVVLDNGVKIAEGTPSEVQRSDAVLEAYLGR